METAIEVKQLFKFKLGIKTLRDVNLAFSYGKTVGILGDAESGKTLLLKTIAGMDKHYEGSIYVDNQKWSHASKAIIAYLGDTFMFESHYKIDQLADIYADLFDDFNALAFDEYLRDLSIGRNARVNTLSLANKKKLQLSFILSRDSPIYLFCEPKDGYDAYTENTLKTFINDHKNPETTIIVTASTPNSLSESFDECVFMKKGEVLIHDTVSAITKDSQSLEEAYKEMVLYDVP